MRNPGRHGGIGMGFHTEEQPKRGWRVVGPLCKCSIATKLWRAVFDYGDGVYCVVVETKLRWVAEAIVREGNE